MILAAMSLVNMFVSFITGLAGIDIDMEDEMMLSYNKDTNVGISPDIATIVNHVDEDVDVDVHVDADDTKDEDEPRNSQMLQSIIPQKDHSIQTNNNNNNNDDNDIHINEYKYDEDEYKAQLIKSMTPDPNQSTCAYLHVFWSGFCNQYYMFSGVLLLAQEGAEKEDGKDLESTSSTYHCPQLLVHSIRWKDLFGTNHLLRHDVFFDVLHWNSYFPTLPRFVTYDEQLFPDLQIPNPNDIMKPILNWNVTESHSLSNVTKPYAIGGTKKTTAISKFYDYTKHVEKGRIQRKKSELLMMKGAFRPHPAIREIMSRFQNVHRMKSIMVLHARIEPDMQRHPMCKEHKVVNLTDIVEMVYEKYPDPPVSTVLIILNRAILEQEVNGNGRKNNKPKEKNEIASNNLKTLNEILVNGLWDGRVKVVEAGSELAKQSKHPIYSKYSSLVGSIMNFFLSLEADIFVGTIVSSYSTAVISYRFFREKKENYFYMPHGLDWVTPPDVEQPPRFAC